MAFSSRFTSWVDRMVATFSEPHATPASRVATADAIRLPKLKLWLLMRKWANIFNIWLWVFVFFPTLCAGVFYFGIASDLYMSEADFIVRGQTSTTPDGILGSLLRSTGLKQSADDTAAVSSFILSRDAVRLLDEHNRLRDVFDRPEADFITRFPNFFTNSSFEKLYEHYLNYVDVTIDSQTGVTRLTVKAYRPEDARMIAQALLADSEALVNELNRRAEADAVAMAQREVQTAEEKLATIQGERASLGQAPPLSKSFNNSRSAPSTSFAEIDRIGLQRDMAQKALASALAALDSARLDAQRHHLYIEHIAAPNLPDYPLYPKRVVSFIIVFVTCFIAYGVAWLLITGIREHAAA